MCVKQHSVPACVSAVHTDSRTECHFSYVWVTLRSLHVFPCRCGEQTFKQWRALPKKEKKCDKTG